MSPALGLQTPLSSAEVLRSIAHELRQPLSTIESIAYYLTLVFPRDDDKLQEQLARLQQLVEQSNWIITTGLQIADPPSISPESVDLEDLILRTALARTTPGDLPRLELASNLPPVRLDRNLGRTLLDNLFTLFRQLASKTHPAFVRTSRSGFKVSMEIVTEEPGYRSEATLGAGSALSLACTRQIVEAHDGTMRLTVDPETGVRLVMEFRAVVLG